MSARTPTIRDLLRRVEDSWADFRNGLRAASQQRFDRLFEYAHRHADAASRQNPRDPLAAVLLATALEQERRIDELESRIDHLRRHVDRIESGRTAGPEDGDGPGTEHRDQ